MRLGIVAIARPTFDVLTAQVIATEAFDNLVRAGHDVIGSSALVMDADSLTGTLGGMAGSPVEALVILQATFSDSSLAVQASDVGMPVVLWAFPEDRTGGRLRLNSFCGINLAGYALTNLDRRYHWIYRSAHDPEAPREIVEKIGTSGERPEVASVLDFGAFPAAARRAAISVRDRLQATTIGRVGEHPAGFEPCSYDARMLVARLGVKVDEVPLSEWFARAENVDAVDASAVREQAEQSLAGLEDVDQVALDRSLDLKVGLQSLVDDGQWAGVATRCWPETFTEFGGAACAPMAMLTEGHTPGSCEADVYGNVTGLVLQWLADQPTFVADLVHLDPATDTGVLWHCGLAPASMADPLSTPSATIHSNRGLPLLNEFPLKPGRVTLARVSQSRRQHRLVVGGGEMIRAPLAFHGTAGVVHFDRPVAEVMATVLGEGLEHHFGIVYDDVREELRALASLLGLPIVELS